MECGYTIGRKDPAKKENKMGLVIGHLSWHGHNNLKKHLPYEMQSFMKSHGLSEQYETLSEDPAHSFVVGVGGLSLCFRSKHGIEQSLHRFYAEVQRRYPTVLFGFEVETLPN